MLTVEEVGTRASEHAFSIEMQSKESIKRVTMSNEAGDKLLIEGILGELQEVNFVEDAMIEIKGANGILRIDLKEEEFRKLLSKGERTS